MNLSAVVAAASPSNRRQHNLLPAHFFTDNQLFTLWHNLQ